MTWIRTVPYADASGRLKTLYDRIKGPDDNVDNIMMAHSLRPHTMEGHMHIYKYVLHHTANTVPKWLLEAIGVWVSRLNACDYCVEHHFAGMARLLGDEARASVIRRAIDAGAPEQAFDGAELAMMRYADALTRRPTEMAEGHVTALREAGVDDGAILEVNQVVAYFNYANRTVLGLGVSTDGDILGLSPGDGDPDNWSHG